MTILLNVSMMIKEVKATLNSAATIEDNWQEGSLKTSVLADYGYSLKKTLQKLEWACGAENTERWLKTLSGENLAAPHGTQADAIMGLIAVQFNCLDRLGEVSWQQTPQYHHDLDVIAQRISELEFQLWELSEGYSDTEGIEKDE